MSVYTDKANKYIDDVISGKIIACDFVKDACLRQKNDLKKSDWEYYFNPLAADRVCEFAESLPHVQGEWSGQLLHLEPWQCFILTTLFGWLRKSDNKRRFNFAYVEVPRKNGKSFLSSVVGLYMFLADGEQGAEIYNAAASLDQALKVFEPAKQIIEKSPDLKEYYSVECFKRSLFCSQTLSKWMLVVGNLDGGNPHCALIDEYHQHADNTVLRTFREGMASRKQPLNFIITTAGTDLSSPCKAMHDHIGQVLSGVLTNDKEFGIIYTIDKEDDWNTKEAFIKANPNYGVSVYDDYINDQLTTARQQVSEQNSIRTKNLNQWMSVNTAFFDILKLRECSDPNLTLEDMKGKKCVIGLDLAAKVDLTALVLLFWDEHGYYSFSNFYLPQNTLMKPQNDHLRGWADMGLIKIHEGAMINQRLIKEDIISLYDEYNVEAVAFDTWNMAQMAMDLEEEGLTMIEVPTQVRHLSEPMKELEGAILDNRYHFDGNLVMLWNFANVVAHRDKKDNVFPNKERNENKIDGAVALITAMSYAIRHKIEAAEPGVFFI